MRDIVKVVDGPHEVSFLEDFYLSNFLNTGFYKETLHQDLKEWQVAVLKYIYYFICWRSFCRGQISQILDR